MKHEIAKNLSRSLSRFLSHFRYCASLPEDIASDLGIKLPKVSSFAQLIEELSKPHIVPEKLYHMMSKEEAERVFIYALKKESFQTTSLFSYRFSEGWLVITLYFNEKDRLIRTYVQCPACGLKEGFNMELAQNPYKLLGSESLVNV